jgi:hypothetical protein
VDTINAERVVRLFSGVMQDTQLPKGVSTMMSSQERSRVKRS